MSLPWRFSSSDRYVSGTVMKIESQSPSFKHLNIGRYYLSSSSSPSSSSSAWTRSSVGAATVGREGIGRNDDDDEDKLTEQQIDFILSAACTNPYLNELTLCGIDVGKNKTTKGINENIAMKRLLQLLTMTVADDGQNIDADTTDAQRTVVQEQQQQQHTHRHNFQRRQRQRVWKRLTFHSTSSSLSSVVGIDLPVPKINHIRIKQCRFNVEQSVALQKNLVLNDRLATIELVEEDLRDPSSILPLALGLASSTTTVKALEFSYCTFSVDSMQCLGDDGLSKNTSLESISLPGCELDDAVAAILVKSISNHPNVRNLKLFRNFCGDKTAIALADLLREECHKDDDRCNDESDIDVDKAKTRLASLDLSYQQFERSKKFDIRPLAESLATNKSLQKLTLSFNKLNDDDAIQLASCLRHNTTLKELDLRANNIRDDGVVSIAVHLIGGISTAAATSLTKLCLFGNPFGERGGESLLEGIRQNTFIKELNMEYNLSQYDTIQYFTYLNRMGRQMLKQGDTVNMRVWPIVLEQANGTLAKQTRGVCTPSDLIYHFIRDPAVFGSFRYAWGESPCA